MSDYQTVLETPELGPGHAREVEAHGRRVLVLNLGQRYYALDARCPESGDRLELRLGRPDDRLVCPADDAAYDLEGRRTDQGGPALARYDIRVEGNSIQVGPPLQ